MRRADLCVILLLLITACGSKHPSSLVGSWKAGEQGFFSSAVVMILKSDGTAEINAAFGIFKTARGTVGWKKEDDKLILLLPNDTSVELGDA